MKKLLLTLGTLTTIAAPVAAVVSCGSSNHGSNGGNTGGPTTGGNTGGFTDGTTHKTQEEVSLDKLLEGTSSTVESWTISSKEVADYITTTKTEGILDLDLGAGDNSKQFENSTPVYTKTFSKQDIIKQSKDIKSGTIFEDIAKEIKTSLKGDDAFKYGLVIKTLNKDNAQNEGNFIVSVFKKTDASLLVLDKASKNIQDEKQFKLDSDKVSLYHGAYTFGQHHNFSGDDITSTKFTMKTSENGFVQMFTGTSGASFFNDRIKEDNFYTWSMIKPQPGASLDGASISDMIYIQDKKTGIYNMRVILSKNGSTRTVYIKNPLITSFALPKDGDTLDRKWMVNKFDKLAFKKIWNDKYNFSSVFSLFNSMKSQAATLNDMEPLKDLIIDISSTINTLASTYNEMKDPVLLDEFITFLQSKYTQDNQAGDMNHLMMGIQDYKMYEEKNMYTKYVPAIGTKGYDGLIWSKNLLDSYVEFIASKVKDGSLVLTKVTSGEGLANVLKSEKELKNKADIVRKYLTDNKITFEKSMTDAEVIKFLVDKANKNIDDSKKVSKDMVAITASDDKHLKDTFDALIQSINKEQAVDTSKMSTIDLETYSLKILNLANEVSKVNIAISSLNKDSNFDASAIIKEVQVLGVKIKGLVSINVPDDVISKFISDIKAAPDNSKGFSAHVDEFHDSKIKVFVMLLGNNDNIFSDETSNYFKSQKSSFKHAVETDIQSGVVQKASGYNLNDYITSLKKVVKTDGDKDLLDAILTLATT